MVVSESQNASVGGKQILDAVLVANDGVDSKMSSDRSELIYKLDIEKTYVHVHWYFPYLLFGADGVQSKVEELYPLLHFYYQGVSSH